MIWKEAIFGKLFLVSEIPTLQKKIASQVWVFMALL